MKPIQQLAFEDEAKTHVYRCIERHGITDIDTISALIDDDIPAEIIVEELIRDGYLEETDGEIHLSIDTGHEQTFSTESFDFTIRPANQGDFSAIIEIIRHITSTRHYAFAESIAHQLQYEKSVTRHNHAQSRIFFVACVDSTVVGWCHLTTKPIQSMDHTAYLSIGVIPAYQSTGIGTELLRRGVKWATNTGFHKLYNRLPSTNTAGISFLTSRGWYVDAVRKQHYNVDDKYIDEVILAIDLFDAGLHESGFPVPVLPAASLPREVAWASGIENAYQTIIALISGMRHGSNYSRGLVSGLDIAGLIELAVTGFSKQWLQQAKAFDTTNQATLGGKSTVDYLKHNPPELQSLPATALFLGGLISGVVLVSLTNLIPWIVGGILGSLNAILKEN